MDKKLKSELESFTYPLRTVIADSDFTDLKPLYEILNNTRIVGLGESTHGTREFFQLKDRITRFLVQKMGYRVFTIEAGMLPCMNINDYIIKGKGDRAEALASQSYWTWDTEEVTEMIKWMRTYNLNCERGEECQFFGYDIKPIEEACRTLRYVTKNVSNEIYKRTDIILKEIEDIPLADRTNYGEILSDKDTLWLLGWLTGHELEICEKVGQPMYELAIISCRMIYQYLDGMLTSYHRTGEMGKRDQYMAENINYLISRMPRDTKIIVWAHNAHISVDESWKNLGWWLRHWYGDLYYTFGLTYTRGTFQARYYKNDEIGPLSEFDAGEPLEDFWEYDLQQIRKGNYFMDLREIKAKGDSAREWACSQIKRIRAIGSGFNPDNPFPDDCIYDSYVLGDMYDGIFHIEKTSRARPTPTGMR